MAINLRLSSISVLLLLLAAASQAANLYDDCSDGAGVRGICVPLKDCDPVGALLRRGGITSNERDYLVKSYCGTNDEGRIICCPLPRMLKARFSAPASLPAVGVCGKATNDRIVGGNVTQLDDYPWLARIQYLKPNLNDPCSDGAGVSGICVQLKDCDSVGALLRRGDFTSNEREYLVKSHCGSNEKGYMVCCPVPRLPPVGVCGKATNDRIVGGNITQLDDYPWLARIQYLKPNKRFGFHCGGVLINERYVLSAAHCVKGVPSSWIVYKIRLGEYDTFNDTMDCSAYDEDDCAKTQQDYLIASYYVHEDYFQENGADYNDLALIRLSVPVTYTPFIQPICLPITPDQQKAATDSTRMIVAGWGQTENVTASQYKMYLAIPGWSNDRCKEAFTSINVDIIDTQLCAGGEVGKDSCRGDSGGPLMKLEQTGGKTAWFLKGIVSFGTDKCGTEDIPGVYTRISKFMDWILENIEE